jgi:uncharacterized protein (TIGR02118 family)
MIKVVVALNRRPDLSVDQFREHFYSTHIDLLRQLPGLRRLVVDLSLPGPDAEPAYDGFGEDWFDDVEAMQQAFGSPAGQAVMADAANFLDLTRLKVVVVEENEVALPGG